MVLLERSRVVTNFQSDEKFWGNSNPLLDGATIQAEVSNILDLMLELPANKSWVMEVTVW